MFYTEGRKLHTCHILLGLVKLSRDANTVTEFFQLFVKATVVMFLFHHINVGSVRRTSTKAPFFKVLFEYWTENHMGLLRNLCVILIKIQIKSILYNNILQESFIRDKILF